MKKPGFRVRADARPGMTFEKAHPCPKSCGVKRMSRLRHSLYLSAGSMLKGGHFASPANRLCSAAGPFGDALAWIRVGCPASLPSGFNAMRITRDTRSEGETP